MKTGIILHSISDAEHCVENKLYEGNMLFSTHTSVDVYLKENHNLDSQCLSKFISEEELKKEKNTFLDSADRLLKRLDSDLSPLLSDKFDLKLNYFIPLYSYLGSFQILGYIWFVKCVKKIVGIYELEKISVYDYGFSFYDHRLGNLLKINTVIGDLVSLFFGNIQTEIIVIPQNKKVTKAKRGLKNIVKKLKILQGHSFEIIFNKILASTRKYGCKKFSDNKKTILISEPLYDLEFLIGHLSKYNILYYDSEKERFLGFKKRYSIPDIDLDFLNSNFVKEYEDPFIQIFLKEIKENFINNIDQCLNIIYLLKDINRKYPISLGVWGAPPAWGARAMIFEYLMSNDIKVIGSQHGGYYGELYLPSQFDTDFNRCDYFISWGFTEEDLKRIYPLKKINTEILPFGRSRLVKSKKDSKKIDILFPITMSFSIFWGGMEWLFPDKLAERQTTLLEYLNSQESLDIYIKPLINSDFRDCSTLPIINRLKNLKVIDNIVLTEFLEKYSPKAVLIEVTSQPLYDALPLDTEIFLISDPVNPYGEKALEELKRRVHYCEDVNEAISKIDLFFKGELGKKRDDTFYKHYMYKENTEDNVLNLIDALVAK